MTERAATLRRTLATVLLGDDSAARRAAARCRAEPGPLELARLAYQWRVLPSFAARGARVGGFDRRDVLGRLVLVASAESGRICKRAVEVLPLLEDHGLPHLVFKGIAAIATLHRSPAARMVSDCDLLIRESDLEPVLEVLAGQGFEARIPGDLRGWRQLLRERAFPDHDFIEVAHPEGTTFDVHWRIHMPRPDAYRTSDLLARAGWGTVLGGSIRVASAPDLLVLTAQHSLREHLAPHVALKDLVDTKAWLAKGGTELIGDALRHAEPAGFARGVAAMVTCLFRFDPNHPAIAQAHRSVCSALGEAERAGARELAEAFEAQLVQGSLHKAVVALSRPSWATLRRYAAGRWRGMWDAEYRATKFRHEPHTTSRSQLRRLLRQTLGLVYRNRGAYRAVARECEAIIGSEDRAG